MTDYNELIKAMRHCVYGDCVDCKYYPSQNCHELLTQAADAIERLHAEWKAEAESVELMLKEMPRWIPVTKRLPGKGEYVLVRYKNNDMAVACWFDGDEDILFWRAITDEGWCADCDTEPTHWMPLPSTEGLNET